MIDDSITSTIQTKKKQKQKREKKEKKRLDTKSELNTHVNLTSHLDHLRELNRLLSCVLQVVNREDLEARLVDLFN